jgi:iron-sulfur cluster assembly protein
MCIEFTDKAAVEAKRILFEHKSDHVSYLRIGIKSGGCAGFTYTMDLCYRPESQDRIFENQGIRLVCDQKSFLYLSGTRIDFQDKPASRGFVFNNPNAKKVCPCGASFGV